MSHYFKKPENALRRATELAASGKNSLALEILYSVMTNRRHRQWTETHEAMMKKFLDVCITTRDKINAKDGLYVYRGLCQKEAPGSLERVVEYLINQAEDRCRKAQQESGRKLSTINTEVAAETIMLNAVTSEGDAERVKREMLVPWIRFLWESYRSVLDIVKNNKYLEDVYHRVCRRAYQFCVDFERSFEFRKLTEMIRRHLSDAQKYQAQDLASGKKPYVLVLTADVFERHLDTRFEQLEAASKLQSWNQAYNTVEEIHSIMGSVDRAIKPHMMASYYKSLSNMFLVSRSYLFHAYSWLKFYNINEKQNRSLDKTELSQMASSLTLAAIAVPVIKRHDSISSYANDEADKHKRMAALLGYSFHPSRELLIEQITSMGLIQQCEPWVRNLFQLLEKDFCPQELVPRAVAHLQAMRQSDQYAPYASGIEELVIIRLCQQLSKVYKTMSLDSLKARLQGITLDFHQTERVILRAVRRHYLAVRIDYRNKCIRFDSGNLEVDRMREQLTQLSVKLNSVMQLIRPVSERDNTQNKAKLVQATVANLEQDHRTVLGRKHLIERMKEERERRGRERKREKQRYEAYQEKLRKEQERLRMEAQKAKRDKDKKLRDEKRAERDKTIALAKQLNINIDAEQVEELSQQELVARRKKETLREHKKMQNKMREQAKRVDYLVRALRDREREVLREYIRDKMDAEEKHFMSEDARMRAKARAEWENRMALKEKTAKMIPFQDAWMDQMRKARAERLVSQRDRLILQARINKRKLKLERANRRILEAKERKKAEEEARIEAERKAAEEAKQREEEQRTLEDAQGGWQRASADPRNRVRDQQRDQGGDNSTADGDRNRDRGYGDRNRDRGYDDRDRGYGDRDSGYGDRDRGYGDRNRGDRNRGYGDRDRDRGYGDRDRGYGDRDRGYGDRDRGYGGRDRGYGGRDGGDRGYGGRDGGDRGFGGRDRGFGDRDRGGFRDRDRGYGGSDGGDRYRSSSSRDNREAGRADNGRWR